MGEIEKTEVREGGKGKAGGELGGKVKEIVDTRVCIIGMGRLGLSYGVSLAERGITVIGVEHDGDKVIKINNGVSPYQETGLQESLPDIVDNGTLRVVQTLDALVDVPPAIIMFVGTPLDKQSGDIDHTYITQALQEIGSKIKTSSEYHTIIIRSTVLPGFCRGAGKVYLENASGKRFNEDFGLCYMPESTQSGNLLNNFRSPDYLVIGISGDRAKESALSFQSMRGYPVIITNLLHAEMFQLALSSFLALKISFANELANLCENIRGADVDILRNVLAADERVGRYCMTGGASFGGTTLPRDISSMLSLSRYVGVRFPLMETVVASNSNTVGRILGMITTRLLNSEVGNRKVAILGLAYKAGVPYKDGSLGYAIAQTLRTLGVSVKTYDPMTADESAAKTAQAAANGVGIVLVANMEEEFKEVEFKKGQIVVDVWRFLDRETVEGQCAEYVGVGIGK